MRTFTRLLPGVGLCTLIILCGGWSAGWIGQGVLILQGLPSDGSSPISGIFMAILIGILIRNTLGLHPVFGDGVQFTVKILLKLGIILLGIRLSFFDVVTLGAWGLPIILTCVLSGLFVTLWITNKLNQSHRLGTLTAVGTGICGVTAIVGISPGIKANDSEMAYAIANITLFGLVAMFVYPYLAYTLFADDPIKIGLFLGTSIHETAQVAGAALIYEQVYSNPQVVEVATITKLTRNVLLVAVVPLMSYYYLKNQRHQRSEEDDCTPSYSPRWYRLIPLFVVGFLLMAIVRSIGDAGFNQPANAAFGLWSSDQWQSIWQTLNASGTYLLGMAMAAVGLSTSFRIFQGIGFKPLYIGLVAAISVSLVSLIMVYLLGDFIQL